MSETDLLRAALDESLGADVLIRDEHWNTIQSRADVLCEKIIKEFCYRPIKELTTEVLTEYRTIIRMYRYELLKNIHVTANNAEYFYDRLKEAQEQLGQSEP